MTTQEVPVTRIDLGLAAEALTALLSGIADDRLDGPTPCGDWTVGDLLDHVHVLGEAFRLAALKESPSGTPPMPDGAALDPDWRTTIPARLAAMADAWRAPEAWAGMTMVGGVEQPGGVCALTGLDELVVHGWDLARSTGQAYHVEPPCVAGAQGFVDLVRAEAPDGVPGLFGRSGPVPAGASDLDRLVAGTGRDPGWRPVS
jgi:uncharacterized protein (TIGR03086 family)